MKIDVRNLLKKEVGAQENEKFSFPLELEEIELLEPIEGEYQLIRLEKNIFGHFYIRSAVKLPCARCLENFNFIVETDFDLEFSQHPGEEFLPIKNFQIDLTQSLREEVLLSLPIKVLCKEACKGLCPNCGQNLNVKSCRCKRID